MTANNFAYLRPFSHAFFLKLNIYCLGGRLPELMHVLLQNVTRERIKTQCLIVMGEFISYLFITDTQERLVRTFVSP